MMKKEVNSNEIFETICFMILNNYVDKIETNKVSIINNYSFEADAIINDKFGRKAVVEVKMYRNFSVNLGLIEKAIEQLRKNSLIFNVNNMVLITSVKLDIHIINRLKGSSNCSLNLGFANSCKSNNTLKYHLLLTLNKHLYMLIHNRCLFYRFY
jgi:hypothetical protein